MIVAPAKPVTVLSLCTGVGGTELGLRLAGLRTRLVCAVERDPYAAAVLLARMEDETLEPAPVWCGNLEQFDARPFAGVGLVTAGYPCPAMSSAGKRLGQRDPRWLWPEVARVVSECRPAYVFLENVGGHLRLAFDDVWSDLGAMGYEREAGLFSAAEVGAPHERERLFVLAHAQSGDKSGQQTGHNSEQIVAGAGAGGGTMAGRNPVGVRVSGHPDPASGTDLRSRDELAHAGCERREGLRPSAPQRLPVAARAGAELADAGTSRLRTSELGLHAGEHDAGWGGVGQFPPGPNDRAGWAYVLARVPTAQPAVCRLAHEPTSGLDATGLTYRMDQLRCLGNGVVPMVAAHAFLTLAERLGIAEELGVTP